MANTFSTDVPYLGPASYENWRAAQAGLPSLGAYEVPLFTDIHVTGEEPDRFGPYAFLNPVALVERGALRPAIVLRVEEHYQEDNESALKAGRSDSERYHGGWLSDEIAALASLSLGARVQAGPASRRFDLGKDPRGRPTHWGIRSNPVLPRASQTVIPSAAKEKALSDLTPLLSLPAIAAADARVVVRAARSYQNAMWVADAEPQLCWLFLVSAAETAAGHWHREREPAVQRLRAWGPGNDVETLLVNGGASALVEQIAELLADYVGSTKKFVEFLMTFCPDPPAERPPSGGQLSWDPKELRKTLLQVYTYRSKALHEGRPFPAPMCEPPMRVDSWAVPPQNPIALSAAYLGGVWRQSDTRILLHSFEWIVRTALVNWFLALDVTLAQTVNQPMGHAVHHEAFVAVSRSLEAISPVRIGDVPYAIWLIDITDSADGHAIDVAIGAKSQSAQHTARLHVDKDRLANPDEIARVAVAVIQRIVAGQLPPGAAETF